MTTDQLLQDLATAGFPVPSVAALRDSGKRYRPAVPILLAALDSCTDVNEREGIVRALSVPWAHPDAVAPLIDEFKQAQHRWGPAGDALAWAAANALEVIWDDQAFDTLADLARDRKYRTARQMLVLGMGKSKVPAAVDILLGLLDDPDVDGHALVALGRLNTVAARPALEARRGDGRVWVRRAVERALAQPAS